MHGFTIKKANGHSVACLEEIPFGAERIAIAVHGFTSSKESPTVQLLLRRLPAAGIGPATAWRNLMRRNSGSKPA